jgi:hypothetical protein
VILQKTQPPQLTLWQTFFPSDPHRKDQDVYSNTAELYDAVPKYFSSKKRMAEQRRDGQFLSSLKHHFRHKDKHYLVKINLARIEEKDGTEWEYYPSWREDLAAVTAGLTLPWSNGPVEGQITRLKLLKRQGYGRAGFALQARRSVARALGPHCLERLQTASRTLVNSTTNIRFVGPLGRLSPTACR